MTEKELKNKLVFLTNIKGKDYYCTYYAKIRDSFFNNGLRGIKLDEAVNKYFKDKSQQIRIQLNNQFHLFN